VIVVDASAATELVLQTALGARVERRLLQVLSALRRLVRMGEVTAGRAEEAMEDLGLLRIVRHGHRDLAMRAWELRENFTAYDAMYLALAESLDATVVTCDGTLGGAPGYFARIDLIR
jgi:predicted nucleic acid-binding protein